MGLLFRDSVYFGFVSCVVLILVLLIDLCFVRWCAFGIAVLMVVAV